MAALKDICLDQGATLTFSVVYRNKETGVGVDLTGWTPKMDVRTDFLNNQPTVEFTLTEGDGLDMSKASEGRIIITISADRSGGLTLSRYRYDMEITKGVEILRLIEGGVNIKPQVTD